MTDAGSQQAESNPFSFKSFLKRTTESGGGSESEGGRRGGRRGQGGRAEGEGTRKKAAAAVKGSGEGLPFPEVDEVNTSGRSWRGCMLLSVS